MGRCGWEAALLELALFEFVNLVPWLRRYVCRETSDDTIGRGTLETAARDRKA